MAAGMAGILLDQHLDQFLVDVKDIRNLRPWLVEFRQSGTLPWVTEYRSWLVTLITVTSKTHQLAIDLFPRRVGRRRGAGGNPVFDEFVKELRTGARASGGQLTLGRDAYADKATVKGPLLDALKILKPYLPKSGFFPAGNLGYALERISRRLTLDAAKTPPVS
jgi:hypothetical protein